MKKQKRILLVEDETIIAIDTKACLEELGYEVVEVCDNGEDALFYAKKYSPDLVLLDIKLSGKLDGTQIAEEIQIKNLIPVVYLTSHADADTLNKAQKTKPYGYILKPVDEKQLNSTIIIALSRFEEEHKVFKDEDKVIKINHHYLYSITKKALYYQEEEIEFTKKEREFIAILVKNLDSTVSNEHLITSLWNDKEVPVATLRSLVRRVREKIPHNLIESSNSVGYKLKSVL